MKERQRIQLIKIKIKKMKRYITSIIAIIIALGAFAFTKDSKQIMNGKVVQTFYYNSALGSDQTDPDNYQLTSVTCNSGSHFVCTIKAENDGNNKPIFQTGTDPVNDPGMYSTTKRQ